MIYAAGKFFFWVFLKSFFGFKVTGKENIPSAGGFIVAGNHVSYLDPIVFGVACPRPLSFMARDTLFRNRFSAWLLRRVNVFPLRRNSADVGAIKEALRRLKYGGGILLFPEGTRSSGGLMKEGFEGVGFLARKSALPVVPMFVRGTQEALPKKARWLKLAKIEVVFGRPLSFPKEKASADHEITEEIMQHIISLKGFINA
jgi:1-acyl-sn-glycerol-3-phosphate acyltransferase